MASVKKLASGRWKARYRQPDGKERAQHFDSKKAATDWLTEIEGSKLAGSWVDPDAGKVLFKDWVEQWQRSTVHLRPSTRARDEQYLRSLILPTFADRQLRTITQPELREWVAAIGVGHAPATVVKAAQIVSKVFAAAVDAGLLALTPYRGIRLPKIERDEIRFLAPDEIARLADAIDPRFRAFVLLGCWGGLRFSELVGLRRGSLDLLRGTVRVHEQLVEVNGTLHAGPPKTKAGRRTIPLPRPVVDALTVHLAEYADEDPQALVFTAPRGGEVRAGVFRSRYWDRAVAAAGLDGLTPHGMRHTAISLWCSAGATPNEVAARAGHSSVTTVLDRYGHLYASDSDRTTDALAAMFVDAPAAATVLPLRPSTP